MNRLRFEKSPYLLQHVNNPVDWYSWNEDAFEKAEREEKPVFLSIGYSTCHWCHVMEHESFEDEEVAQLMNDVFVSIKVDREERPDIDGIYMTVCQMITNSGGWPLTIFMTPEKKPFFATTYIPKKSNYGRVGLMDLIPKIKELWETKRNELISSADKISNLLKETPKSSSIKVLDDSILKLARKQLSSRYDKIHGGFGSSPKFPTPHNLMFLLRYWRHYGDEDSLEIVEKTLKTMRNGGIYDHIGFGFHRYSTDPEWLVPHFEKMLYDQAMLSMTYVEAYQATQKEAYKETAEEIFAYVLRDMAAPGGGFYSAEDADSEGKEGKFYIWEIDEIQKVLDRDESDLIIKVFNIEKDGNFFEEISSKHTGSSILYLKKPIKEIASDLKMAENEFKVILEAICQKLFKIREKRVHPLKDDKILTDWNGLMIAAFAKGAQVFDNHTYLKAARNAADFILNNMKISDVRLLHRFRDGQAKIHGYLDDYAFMIWGLIELYEATFEISYLKTAIELNRTLLSQFWDERGGGFYFSPDDGEELLTRQKEIYDGAVPSGNSVSMFNLIRLGRITANQEFVEKAESIGQTFYEQVKELPSAYTQLMSAIDFVTGKSHEVVIVGKTESEDTKAMLKALRRKFIPNKIVLFRPSEQELPEIGSLSEFIKNKESLNSKATAYVCSDYTCKSPTTDISEMLSMLQ